MSDFEQPLKPGLLLKRCNPADFDFSTTEALPEIGPAIGQERALEALRSGLSTTQDGFNLFALGPYGLGKTAAVKERVAEASRLGPCRMTGVMSTTSRTQASQGCSVCRPERASGLPMTSTSSLKRCLPPYLPRLKSRAIANRPKPSRKTSIGGRLGY